MTIHVKRAIGPEEARLRFLVEDPDFNAMESLL